MDNNLAALHTPITAPTEAAEHPFSNCFKDSRNQIWRSTGLVETIVYDFTYQAPIGFFSMIGSHDTEFGLTPSATITVEGNNINDWTSPPFSQTVTATDEGASAFLDTDTGVPSYRYWRIFIDDSTNNNPTFALGILYLGDYTTLTHRNVQSGFKRTTEDPSTRIQSESGALYHDTKTKYLAFSGLSIGYMDPIDRANVELVFSEFGIDRPMFISLDPTLKMSTDIHEMTRYMVFKDKPTFNHIKQSIYTMSLNIREFV